MDLGLRDKCALVMGASKGIGRGIAEAFCAEGARVAICARNEEQLSLAAREMGASVAIAKDLSHKGAVLELFKMVEQKCGIPDIVVFNHGGPDTGLFSDLPYEKWAQTFEALWAYFIEGLHTVLPKMKEKRWGRVLVVTSVAGKEPVQGLTLSNAFRAGIHGLINSLSREYGSYNITFNAIMPGYIRTDRLKHLKTSEERLLENVAIKRLGEPKDIGALAAFLASEQASYMTGQAIACDGGYLRGI